VFVPFQLTVCLVVLWRFYSCFNQKCGIPPGEEYPVMLFLTEVSLTIS